MQWNVIITTKQTLSTHCRTSFSWSLGNQFLKHFKKSHLTLKETIAKRWTATMTSNTQMWTATPNYSRRSIAKGSKVLQVNRPVLSPSIQVSAALKACTLGQTLTPHSPDPGWGNSEFLPFTRLHSSFGGDGGLLFHFILDKINGKPRPPLPPKSRMGKWHVFLICPSRGFILDLGGYWGNGGLMFHFILHEVSRKV